MLRRLAALPAREEALEPAVEPGLELAFFPRALPVSGTPGNEREIIRMVFDNCARIQNFTPIVSKRNLPKLICACAAGCVGHSL